MPGDLREKPAGTDPVAFRSDEECIFAIHGAMLVGWMAEAKRYLAWWAALARASSPEPESAGCPSGECGNGVICTGCRIDHEIAKATAQPALTYAAAPAPRPPTPEDDDA